MIKVTYETDLFGFADECWGGAKDTMNELTMDQIEELDRFIEEAYPDGLTEVELNDMLWFDRDAIANILGFKDYDELLDNNYHN